MRSFAYVDPQAGVVAHVVWPGALGAALSPDGQRLYVVGTGPAGGAADGSRSPVAATSGRMT